MDLVETIGRKEIWRALKTGDHKEAVRRYGPARAALDDWFDEQRQRRNAGEKLSADVRRLVGEWFGQAETKAACADFGLFGDQIREALGETEQELFDLIEGGDGEAVTAAVHAILLDRGWPSRRHRVGSIWASRSRMADTDVPPEMLDLVRRGLVELARRRRDRLSGQAAQVRDPIFAGDPRANGTPAGVQPGASSDPGTDGITLDALIICFEADRAPGLRDKTQTDCGLLFRALGELWTEAKPVRSITREDCRRVRDLFAALPSNCEKRWPGLSLVKAAENARANGIRAMNPRTANKHVARLSTLLRWAEREEYVIKNVAVGLKVPEPEADARDARRPFTAAQLQRVFAAPLYTGCVDDWHGYATPGPNVIRRGRFWVPVLSLFGGLRMGEACQLAVADVVTREGVPVILVRPDADAGTRVKSKSGRRVVPVHPELVRIGFVEFVESMRQAGETRLFPELRKDRRGSYSGHFQRWANRFLDKAGAKGPRQSFHSLRHTWRDTLREAGVSRDAVLALGGWSAGGVEEDYGGGLRPSTLARELARVRYPGLNLSHLHPDFSNPEARWVF